MTFSSSSSSLGGITTTTTTTTTTTATTVASSPPESSPGKLSCVRAAILLTAECLGTGILALPQAIATLGRPFGIAFLVLQLPVNLYAGTILARAAEHVEQESVASIEEEAAEPTDTDRQQQPQSAPPRSTVKRIQQQARYESIVQANNSSTASFQDEPSSSGNTAATADVVGMNAALFRGSYSTNLVLAIYYTNIFLVLGDYILVQSHAVVALFDSEKLCLPTAGILACIVMFLLSQLRTMAHLGKSASIISLLALFIVVILCLASLEEDEDVPQQQQQQQDSSSSTPIVAKLSSMASIGFAVGSQKLFLNIRHEMANKKESTKSLALSLTFYVGVYVVICLLAGRSPPGFLFDAIAPSSTTKRIAGLLLWIHVAVSYAINSQALCVSMDRLYFGESLDSPRIRWMGLTAGLALASYLVANAVPFFKDLISITGALTTVPLTLLLPAVYYAKSQGRLSICCCWPFSFQCSLLIFSILFMIMGLVGALSEIELDWKSHGPPFSCR